MDPTRVQLWMDYPCAKCGDFSFSRFGFMIMRTDTQNHRVPTDRITDADDRYTHVTTVGVSNNAFLVVVPDVNMSHISQMLT